MAITFTNIWQTKVIDPLVSMLRTEFGNACKVYTSDMFEPTGNCGLRVHGLSQNLVRISNGAFSNEYKVELTYYLIASNYSDKGIEKVYRDISRIEQLLFNKRQPSGRSETSNFNFYDGRIENIQINEKDSDEEDVDSLLTAKMEFVCIYSKV